MFHAQCQELSLSTDAFSRSHEYNRSVVALGPHTIHTGDRPSHQRMPIDGAPRTHVRGQLYSHLVLY